MPNKILNVYFIFRDPSTNGLGEGPLDGATVFSTSTVEDNGVLTLVGHSDINGNVLINTDDPLEYIVTALYLTEDNLQIQVPNTTAPSDFQSFQNVVNNTPSTPGTTTVITDPTVIAQQNAAANIAAGSFTTAKINYYELEAYLTQSPYNQPLGSVARFSPTDFTTILNEDYSKRVILQLTPEARASQYFPTNAQISRIPIVSLPAVNTVTEVPRGTMSDEPDPTTTATSQLNTEIKTENNKTLDRTLKSQLAPQARLVNIFNTQKDKIRRKIIPFLIALLLPFGAAALQAVLAKLPLSTIKDLASCPNRAELLRLIEKRNKLVRQINAIYKTVTTLSKITIGLNTAVTAIRIGILAATFVPLPAPPGVPVGLAKLEETAKKFNVVLNVATVALATIGTLLGVILVILRSLDALMLQCAEDPNYNTPPNEPLPVDAGDVRIAIPFEEINTELDGFINESTGLNNSNVIQATQNNNTYKGFTLELKLDTASSSSYPRRFAQAINRQGVPVLKTDSSFASDPQVLLDQLKFIIDSNPQLTAE
jgi:hypothetical protein